MSLKRAIAGLRELLSYSQIFSLCWAEGGSFIWCNTFLFGIPSSWLRLLPLVRCCWFLGAVFGHVRGGGGPRLTCIGGGFGGQWGLWGSVGGMSSTPSFIPGRGRVTSPPASLLSHRGLPTGIKGQRHHMYISYKGWVLNRCQACNTISHFYFNVQI